MESPALCIDLGASFTKIAIRTEADGQSILLQDFRLMTGRGEEDNRFCFPSVVAHNQRTHQWACGWEAADYRQSDDILILQDWKSVLFHEKFLEEFFDPEVDGEVDPVKIFLKTRDPYFIALACAQHYLKWLHDEQIPYLLSQHARLEHLTVADFETRVCVPDFVLGTGAGQTIERLMAVAGFENGDAFCISEPKSSLIGILTEGRNQLTSKGKINNAAMFGDHSLLESLTSQHSSVLFLDIGSFTTDIALAQFSNFRSQHLAKSPAASFPLGMYRLDSMILNALPKSLDHKVNLNNLPATEKFHRAVYHHSKLRQFAKSENISLGDGTEIPLAIVNACLDEFTNAIIVSLKTFLTRHKRGQIHSVVLTGGASLPSRISDRIVASLEKLNFPLLRGHFGLAATTMPVDPIKPELVRGASAIGGVSILYTAENDGAWDEEKVTTEEVVRNLFGALR
jgi:hypothetical protein